VGGISVGVTGKLEPNAARWPTNERTENPEPNRDANDAPVSVHKNKRDNILNQIVLLYFSLVVFPMLPTHNNNNTTTFRGGKM
jgi:hypothetical protein